MAKLRAPPPPPLPPPPKLEDAARVTRSAAKQAWGHPRPRQRQRASAVDAGRRGGCRWPREAAAAAEAAAAGAGWTGGGEKAAAAGRLPLALDVVGVDVAAEGRHTRKAIKTRRALALKLNVPRSATLPYPGAWRVSVLRGAAPCAPGRRSRPGGPLHSN